MTNNTMQYIVLAEELFTAITLNPNQPRAVTKGTGTLRMETQLKKGLLEYCVLAAVCRCDSYGYQIIKDIGGCVSISESTLPHHGFGTGTNAGIFTGMGTGIPNL